MVLKEIFAADVAPALHSGEVAYHEPRAAHYGKLRLVQAVECVGLVVFENRPGDVIRFPTGLARGPGEFCLFSRRK
jgi:hypothetical protein